MNYENLYKTKDQYLASLLYSLKQKLIHTEYEDRVCYFFFADNEICEQIISDYFMNNLSINPKDLVDAHKTIKTIVYKN